MATVKFDTPKLDKLEKEIKWLNRHGVKVGFIGNETQEGVKIYEYSFFLNEGTVFMPPRPFFDDATRIYSAKKDIAKYQKIILRKVFDGEITGKQALNQLGIYIVQKIKKNISSNNYAPVKNPDKKDRNNGNVLREHDFMLKAVNFEIIRI